MSWFGVLALVVIALFVLFQLSIYIQSKRMVGKDAPVLDGMTAEEGGGSQLIYFHSPNCGPCRSMSPQVAALAEKYPNVRSIDISQDMATALKYNVRATPTTVLVRDGKVTKVLLGAQSGAKLERLLQGE